MSARKHFGTDGIRGRVGEGAISADFVLRLGNAYGHALVAAAAFAIILRPDPPLFIAVHAGFLTGLAYVAMSFGINYAFAGRSFKLWLIDGGYHTLQFTLYGLILGLWH